jgi:hypothetical protein
MSLSVKGREKGNEEEKTEMFEQRGMGMYELS